MVNDRKGSPLKIKRDTIYQKDQVTYISDKVGANLRSESAAANDGGGRLVFTEYRIRIQTMLQCLFTVSDEPLDKLSSQGLNVLMWGQYTHLRTQRMLDAICMTRRPVKRAMLHKAASSLSWDRSASRPLDSEEQVESMVYSDLVSGAVHGTLEIIRRDPRYLRLWNTVRHGNTMGENVPFT